MNRELTYEEERRRREIDELLEKKLQFVYQTEGIVKKLGELTNMWDRLEIIPNHDGPADIKKHYSPEVEKAIESAKALIETIRKSIFEPKEHL